jgi:hypothetical protein
MCQLITDDIGPEKSWEDHGSSARIGDQDQDQDQDQEQDHQHLQARN